MLTESHLPQTSHSRQTAHAQFGMPWEKKAARANSRYVRRSGHSSAGGTRSHHHRQRESNCSPSAEAQQKLGKTLSCPPGSTWAQAGNRVAGRDSRAAAVVDRTAAGSSCNSATGRALQHSSRPATGHLAPAGGKRKDRTRETRNGSQY